MEKSIRTWWSVKYDGTNSADVLTVANKTVTSIPVLSSSIVFWSWDIVAADGFSVTIRRTDQSGGVKLFTANVGDWFLVRGDSAIAVVISDAAYQACFTALEELTANILTTAAMQAALQEQGAFGIASVPSLTVLAPTATVQVTIKPARPVTPSLANCAAILYGSAPILAGLSVTGINPVSGSRIDVTVTLVGVATISGGSVFVHVA